MDTVDRALCVVFLILVAWPDQWLRVAFLVLLFVAETRLGHVEEHQIYDVKIKKWERRCVAAFAGILALSKILWWCTFCFGVCLGLRQVVRGRGESVVPANTFIV